MPQDVKKYAYIDALRGIAILGVILVHASQAVGPGSEGVLRIMGMGARGVQLFYVASALTLCLSWAARSRHEASPIRNFFIRRFFRIAPAFYIALIVYVSLHGLAATPDAPNGLHWWIIPLTAVFLNGWHPETILSVVPGGWSIAVEMTFYLLLPLLLRYIKSITSCLIVLAVSLGLYALNGFLVPILFDYPDSQKYLADNFIYFNFFGQLPIFILGILCYRILLKNYPKPRIAAVGLPVFIGILLYLMKSSHHILLSGVLLAAFALLLANWPVRLLVNPALTFLGKLSFSLYLTHFGVLEVFEKLGWSQRFPHSAVGSVAHYACVVVASVAVSSITYECIEKPGISLGKRLINRLEKSDLSPRKA